MTIYAKLKFASYLEACVHVSEYSISRLPYFHEIRFIGIQTQYEVIHNVTWLQIVMSIANIINMLQFNASKCCISLQNVDVISYCAEVSYSNHFIKHLGKTDI